MKVVTSNCEHNFLTKVCGKNGPGIRLDGRTKYDGRTVEIVFGKDLGCCIVMLGNTRVLAQVSSTVSQPKPSRPTEGSLQVYLELSPMGAPNFEPGKMSEEGIENARLLERCIRDSRCVDLESLCIVAGEKAWNIRVDVHVLNHDGNILECSSVAAIAALAHFRRPDVTVIGTDVTVHSLDDHNPVPLNLHHMPVIISMAIYDEGQSVIIDPTEIEERVAEGRFVVGINAHQEICLSHFSGGLSLLKEKILQCTDLAVRRAQVVTMTIRKALEDDAYKKKIKDNVGFVSLLNTSSILGTKYVTSVDKLAKVIPAPPPVEPVEIEIDSEEDQLEPHLIEYPPVVSRVQNFLAETAVFEGGSSKWQIQEPEDEEGELGSSESLEEGEIKQEKFLPDDSDSEEDAAVLKADQVEGREAVLKADQLEGRDLNIDRRGWYNKTPF